MKRLLLCTTLVAFVALPCFADDPPPEDPELKKLKDDLSKLQEENKRLDELTKLRTEISRLKDENKRLKDELAGVKAPPYVEAPKVALLIPRDRWDFRNLSAALPLKVISLMPRDTNEVGITLEFTRSMEAKDIVLLNQILGAERAPIGFWFVDREGVTIFTQNRFLLEGEITGRQGEAFRLLVKLPEADVAKQVSRVEIRPTN